MRIKICGITRLEDALLAVEAGAWAVGFIFVKNTPRYIAPEQAGLIIKQLPESLEKVGVFANAQPDGVINAAESAGVTKVQLHGSESPEYCYKINIITGMDIIKAIRVKDISDLELIKPYTGKVSYILLDTFCERQMGGTGKTFDWEIAKQAGRYNVPIILAGGLNPDNLETAYNKVKPFALDLSSGVEKEKGVKDPHKLEMIKFLTKKKSSPAN